MNQDKGVRRMRDHRLKNFTRVGEGLIDRPLTNRADLNEMLFGVEKNNTEQLTIKKAHLGTRSAIAMGLSIVSD